MHTYELTRRRFFLHAALSGLAGYCGALPGAAAPDEETLAERISDAAIARRKQRILQAIAGDPSFSMRKTNPKYQHAIAGARLVLNPQDAAALEYIRRVAAHDDMFSYQGLAANFALLGEKHSAELTEAVRKSVTAWKGFLGGGTENMVAMRRAAGVLFGERFPDEKFQFDLTGSQVLDECKNFMSRYGHAVFGGSMVEYLSPIYVATSSAAWLNCAEHARDDEARLMGEALLDWIYADVAVNSFACSTVAPLQREKGLLTGTWQHAFPDTNTQWVSWMLFGGGNVPDGPFAAGREPFKAPIGFHAMTKWAPHPVIRNIAAQRVAMPYSLRQSRAGWGYIEPVMVNRYAKKASADPTGPGLDDARYHMRSAYFHRDYAIGAGYFKADPEEPLTRTLLPFGVWWRSKNDNNFLLVAHPFWFAEMHGDEGEPPLGDNDWLGLSPFCRAVHHENAAVLLYDLPDQDPYLDLPERGGAKARIKRSGNIIKSVFVHLPATVDERVQNDAGFFVREGDVYISIRPLTKEACWTEGGHEGFVRIQVSGSMTGVVIEVGDRGEYGTFQEFQARVAACQLGLTQMHSAKSVACTTTRGHHLSVKSVPGTWLPEATVNGGRLDFEHWPNAESPFVNSTDHVLEVNDGRQGFSIDWRGRFPIYTYYDLRAGRRIETRRRCIQDGRMVTQDL